MSKGGQADGELDLPSLWDAGVSPPLSLLLDELALLLKPLATHLEILSYLTNK